MTMPRPTRDQSLMSVAKVMAKRSTCSRASVGVVIARQGRILTTGYNGAPAKMAHCNHLCNCRIANDPSKTPSKHLSWCASLGPCLLSIHAEANAIAYAAQFGINLANSELYTTYMPCLPCAQLIVSVGVTKVYAANAYRDQSGKRLLEEAKVDIIEL